MKSLELGVVGFGKLGLLHAALANALPGCRLAAVVDPQSNMLAMLQTQMPEVSIFTNHNDLIRQKKLDGVFIATPTHLHITPAVDFVRAGIPVFIEKPLSISAAQADPLISALKEQPVACSVGYMSRYSDTFIKAKEIIDSGALGRPQRLKATMYISQLFKTGKGWRYKASTSGGGVLITQNSHLIDMMYWIFGEVKWVSGHTQNLYSEEVEDAAHGVLEFDSGLKASIDTSWSARHHRTLSMNFSYQGENGTLDFNEDEVKLFLESPKKNLSAGWSAWKKPDLFEGVSVDIGGPHYTRQAEAFVRSIRDGSPLHNDVKAAYQVQRIIDAFYASARENGVPKTLERT